ncbi:hypothetical protein EXIGLDRAFT_383643 [Exidia glandulosa HHB12029]|uniref:Uncharacterized protein n=1 Tax=Exidia glandulosa HHB12029 TaxID=1314781 RepID=A0A165L366_EXIGL|nr:hypothetical protein EXIGLDRAFT_383643 [Exidia glandulosa HHB12029]
MHNCLSTCLALPRNAKHLTRRHPHDHVCITYSMPSSSSIRTLHEFELLPERTALDSAGATYRGPP